MQLAAITVIAGQAEAQAVILGQTLDVLGIGWMHHLKDEDKERLGKWSELLDDMRSRLRDMACDYTPVEPAVEREASETKGGTAE